MLLIRRFEEKVEERFRAGELPGFLHVAIGQEAVAVGVCQAMDDGDVFASTHRAHGHTLARGHAPERGHGGALREDRGLLARLRRLDAPLRRRAREPRRERASSAAGCRRSPARRSRSRCASEPRVAVAFFGDGATNIGTFHEALNLAQLWQVPAVFVCENNHWAESTPREQQLADRGSAASAPSPSACTSITVDGQDVEAVLQGRGPGAQARARRQGPGLPRSRAPTGSSATTSATRRSTATKEELQERAETQDPIDAAARAARALRRRTSRSSTARSHELVEASVEFAQERHRPEARGRPQERLCLSCPTARRFATRSSQAMRRRRRRLHHGRGHRRDGRLDGRHAGHARRVRRRSACATRRSPRWRSSAPASAAAMQGMRPVVEIMYEDFLTLAMEQIVNQAAKHRYDVGRPAEGAADDPHPGRRRLVAGRAARAAARGAGSCTCRG